MQPDFVIQPVGDVMPLIHSRTAVGHARLGLGEVPVLENIGGLVIQAVRDEVVLQAELDFLLVEIPLGIIRLPKPARVILRLNELRKARTNIAARLAYVPPRRATSFAPSWWCGWPTESCLKDLKWNCTASSCSCKQKIHPDFETAPDNRRRQNASASPAFKSTAPR